MMKTSAVVVIPLYRNFLSPSEKISISFTIRNLSSYSLCFISPAFLGSDSKFRELIESYNIEAHFFSDKYFKNIRGYNKLLLSKQFYAFFADYEYMLICQLDALALSDSLPYWKQKKYDYIGAPWVTGGNSPAFDAMGNGGFSLRRIRFFSDVLSSSDFFYSSFKYYTTSVRLGIKNLILIRLLALMKSVNIKINYVRFFLFFFSGNEDFFWAFCACFFVKNKNFPSPNEAVGFAFEMDPRRCFSENRHNLPFGCHAWERYDHKFWQDVVSELKELEGPDR